MNHTKTAVDIFNKLAFEYQKKFMDVSLYSESFDFFCDKLKSEACIIELACGPGNITKYLLNKRADLKVLGTDLAPKMIELAKQNNPSAEFQLLDGRNLLSVNRKFDAVLCGFLFPYLNKQDALQLIADAQYSLKPNGLLYLSTMEDDYTKSGMKKGGSGDEIFMHFHEAQYLIQSLESNKFEILKVERKASESAGEKVTDLILIARKN